MTESQIRDAMTTRAVGHILTRRPDLALGLMLCSLGMQVQTRELYRPRHLSTEYLIGPDPAVSRDAVRYTHRGGDYG